jgi:hypothetical protein
MHRFTFVAALMAAACALLAPAAGAHKADPNYLTTITGMPDGVRVTVVNRGDQLLLQNTSGKDVVIKGYEDEDYARVMGDGTVEVNTNSPAYYLNQDRFGTAKAPPGVTSKSPAKWKTLDKTGRFEWHDHRMHWMGKARPQQVKDQDVKTKVFDWKVPVTVGGQPAAVSGSLYWTPIPSGGAPAGSLIAFAVIVLMLTLVVILVRRRREPTRDDAPAAAEAW